jgi:hypothetical protein
VDLTDHVRPGEHEVIVAALECLAAEVLCREVVTLNTCAHGPIEDQDAAGQCVEVSGAGGRV